MHSPAPFRPPPRARESAFTLIELLVVISIMLILMGLLVPAMNPLKGAGDITNAAYTIKGVLEQARTYAIANNTYTWVGFFEEDASTSGTAGTGRLVMSIAASKNGTQGFDPNAAAGATNRLDPAALTPVTKLIKIEQVHLPILTDGAGTGTDFDTRPIPDLTFDASCSCNSSRDARIGEINASPVAQSAPHTNTAFPLQYPVGSPAPTAQYTFLKTVQFSPRGEVRINSTYSLRRVLEIGLIATHGNVTPSPSPSPGAYSGNVVALQIAGIGGSVKIYRR